MGAATIAPSFLWEPLNILRAVSGEKILRQSKQKIARRAYPLRRIFVTNDGKDSADSPCEGFLEVPLCHSSTCLFQSPARNGRLYAIVLYSFSQKKSRGFHEVPGSHPVPASSPCPSFCTIGRQNRNAEFQSTKKQAFSACFALFSPAFYMRFFGCPPLSGCFVQYAKYPIHRKDRRHTPRWAPRDVGSPGGVPPQITS